MSGQGALEVATAIVETIGPRPAGSPAVARTYERIREELTGTGFDPVPWDGARSSGLLACRGDSPDVLLLFAHVDTVHAEVPGANDNAAAIGVLIELAHRLGDTPRTVCLAFPDGEELGLLGSSALAENGLLPGVVDQVVALDLVGRGTLTHNGLGPGFSASDARALLAAAPADVPWVYRAMSHGLPHMERSDHGPFVALGLPASHLMGRGEAGVDWAYHTPEDLPGRLDLRTLGDAVDALEGVAGMQPLTGGHGEPWFVVPWTQIVLPGAVTWVVLAIGLIGGVAGVVRGPATRTPWPAVGAALAAGSLAIGLAGVRPFHAQLAEPVVLAGWSAWWATLWAVGGTSGPWVARLAVAGCALLAGFLVVVGVPLLALPVAVAAGGVGLAYAAGRAGKWPAWALGVALAAWPALYLVRPDAVRELAFHGLVPANGLVWAGLFAVLALPATAAICVVLEHARRPAIAAIVLWAVVTVQAWVAPVHGPPFEARAPRSPQVQRSAPLPVAPDAIPPTPRSVP